MGILYIDKPKGMTSFDVCFKLRKVLGTKKIGHTGTLDPNATGVMVVLYDKDSKANQFLVTDYKEYIGTCKLGIKTDTLDIDGNIVEERKCIMPPKNDLIYVLNSFKGKSLQYPPMTSAVKVNGKKLYEYQREGKTIEVAPREIDVREIELLDINDEYFTFRCNVSSGTYIRVLLEDVLNKLDLIGTLSDLRRTKVDEIDVSTCDKLENVLNGEYHVHDLYEVLSKKYPVVEVNRPQDILNGKPFRYDGDDELILLVHNKKCLAIYYKENGVYRSKRGLF